MTNGEYTPRTTGADIAVKRRRMVTGLVLLALVVTVVAGVWGLLLYDQTHPFPARSDIISMTVVVQFWAFDGDKKISPFEIPEEHWETVLAALTPYEPDPEPSLWMWLCNLSIRTKAGREYCVAVYWLEDDHPGAFSVYPPTRSTVRSYFRGGDSIQLRDAIVAAYEAQAHLVPQ